MMMNEMNAFHNSIELMPYIYKIECIFTDNLFIYILNFI